VGAGLAAILAYISNRRIIAGHQLLGFLAVAPVVIPGVVLAVALFVAYTRPPLLLYGTLWILFLAYLTKEMPVGYAQSAAPIHGSAASPRGWKRPDGSSAPAACASSERSPRRSRVAGSSLPGASSSSA